MEELQDGSRVNCRVEGSLKHVQVHRCDQHLIFEPQMSVVTFSAIGSAFSRERHGGEKAGSEYPMADISVSQGVEVVCQIALSGASIAAA
jgi:hypothetical protein